MEYDYYNYKPKTPADKKLEIFLVGDYVLGEFMENMSNDILGDFPHLMKSMLSIFL